MVDAAPSARHALRWIQAQGGWSSAKLLLDTYGTFIPHATGMLADVLARAEPGQQPLTRLEPGSPHEPSEIVQIVRSRVSQHRYLGEQGGDLRISSWHIRVIGARV